ncbi:DUF192 domain-containing protein [Candidatus Pacearchaeota archaeon]|nr:DUF192 domain-containing protein [Candidatus Pacearchaeota archaeon]
MNKKRKIAFGFNRKKYSISEYNVCSNVFSKARGLMFRPRGYKTPLLFVFSKPGFHAIHSFFCRKFIAAWFLEKNGKLEFIEAKIVSPWKSAVNCSKKFNFLLEIPLG